MSKKTIFQIIFIILFVMSCSDDELTAVSLSKKEIITSQVINDDYEIYYFLPPNYSDDKKYPIIYLLDGDWHTERMANEINVMWEKNEIPECILVGIGNAQERIRDYTFPADEYNEGSGQADKYYEFLRDELLPHVESKYSVDNTQRIIAGHSLGGFLVLYAMFQDNNSTKLFSGVVAASPSIWWENAYLLGLEEKYAETQTDLPVKILFSGGSDEGVTNMLNTEISDRLKSRGYPNFNTEQIKFKNKGHEGASIIGFTEGLKFILTQK